MFNVILDTNLLISGLLNGQVPRRILLALKKNKFQIILSKNLLNELLLTARKSKFGEIISEGNIVTLELFLRSKARFVEPISEPNDCRDPKDNIFLACAIASKADLIVTWDEDLKILSPYRGIEIISPVEFLKRLSG